MNRSASGSSSEVVSVNWTKWIRQIHRWLSIAFTLAVIANLVAMAKEKNVVWVGLLALFPLIVLLFTGLYLFALPYVSKWRSGRRTG
ncbi:hypothetical protein [Archangium violaceum]|uniref:hypothetical protein n=1 Tax=Archangium violaceum TaxID=83451 RepID=UPI0037BE356B